MSTQVLDKILDRVRRIVNNFDSHSPSRPSGQEVAILFVVEGIGVEYLAWRACCVGISLKLIVNKIAGMTAVVLVQLATRGHV